MANTYITSGSRFTPFTFDKMIKPANMYKEAYEKADLELNTLIENAAETEFGFAPQDVAEKTQYDDITSQLKGLSDQLATSGLNPQLTKDLSKLNKEYRKVIAPMQKKITKRAALAEEQRALAAKYPEIRFDVDYSTAPLSAITDNSSWNAVDLEHVGKNAQTKMLSHISTKPIEPEYTPVGGGIYNVKFGYGYSEEEFLEGMKDKSSDIYKLYTQLVNTYTKDTFSDEVNEEIADRVFTEMYNNANKIDNKELKSSSSNNYSGFWLTDPESSTDGKAIWMSKSGTPYTIDLNSGTITKPGTTGDGNNKGTSSGMIPDLAGKYYGYYNGKKVAADFGTLKNRGDYTRMPTNWDTLQTSYPNLATYVQELADNNGITVEDILNNYSLYLNVLTYHTGKKKEGTVVEEPYISFVEKVKGTVTESPEDNYEEQEVFDPNEAPE